MLNRNTVEPLYLQLKRDLSRRIRDGEFSSGQFIPTEESLQQSYDVSRITVRNALKALVNEGVLARDRGKGTVVLRTAPVAGKRGSLSLGIVMNRLNSEFTGAVLAGFEATARESNAIVTVHASDEDSRVELDCVDRLHDAGVKSISVIPCETSNSMAALRELRESRIHVGLIDRDAGLGDFDYVGSDHASGAYSAAVHLVRHGFKDLLFVSYPSTISSVQERYEGFTRALRDQGANEVCEPVYFEQLERTLRRFAKSVPIGIVAVNDFVAIRCFPAIEAADRRIGADVGVVGFDNLLQDRFLTPSLTSVSQNGYSLGRRAAEQAVSALREERTEIERTMLPTQLVVRKSCGE